MDKIAEIIPEDDGGKNVDAPVIKENVAKDSQDQESNPGE